MRPLSLGEFEARAAEYDAAVEATPHIDPFCSRSAWILSVRETWAPRSETWIRRGESGFAVLIGEGARGRGLDVMWRFASPLAGPDPDALAAEFAEACGGFASILLPGLLPGSALWDALVDRLSPRARLAKGDPARRWVASLEGGLDGFLERRSAKLRANLRRADRRARAAGVTFEAARGGDALLDRMVAVERHSWKGERGTGLLAADMCAFYGSLVRRLEDAVRAIFARRDGEDVGYILGAVAPGVYRGLQFSYDERLRDLSLGALLQREQIASLAGEGIALYDLGMDMPYKRRWADGPVETWTLAARLRP